MRNTKIICTLGPAVDSEEGIRALIENGMNAARFNFSHGSHESHLQTFRRLQKVREEMGVPVAAILDTKGPEIRTGSFSGGKVELKAGSTFTLFCTEHDGDASGASVSYTELWREIKPGERVLLDDGLIELRAEEILDKAIRCTVLNDGEISAHKGVNLPDTHIGLPAVNEKDRRDLIFAAQHGFDFIAASFIRSAADVAAVRAVLEENGASGIRIIAKIENREGVNNIGEIMNAADAIMVARGDLGVEIPAGEVPVVQKRIVREALRRGKVVIIATQMLDSMIRNPRPTRAEVSDVANAILDGASTVMLSGETASGKYPIEAVRTMAETIDVTESSIDAWRRLKSWQRMDNGSITEAITMACCSMAMDLNAKAILCLTRSGRTAHMVARFRPGCPIIAVTPNERVWRQLAISRGVAPLKSVFLQGTDAIVADGMHCATEAGFVSDGDLVVITVGGKGGITNLVEAQIIGE